MRRLLIGLALMLTPTLAAAQDNLPKFLKIANLPGIDVRWVDFGWNAEAFASMESGGAHPAAGRSWMLALLRLENPVKWEGRTLPVGAALLVLNPKRGEAAFNLELRDIDLRNVPFQANVIGIPPPGEKIHQVPVRFETVEETRERLDLALSAAGRDALLTIHYGNRKATLKLSPRGD